MKQKFLLSGGIAALLLLCFVCVQPIRSKPSDSIREFMGIESKSLIKGESVENVTLTSPGHRTAQNTVLRVSIDSRRDSEIEGELFYRLRDGDAESLARRQPIFRGTVSLGVLNESVVAPIAALVNGQAFKARLSDSEVAEIELFPFDGIVLWVEGPDGIPSDQLHVQLGPDSNSDHNEINPGPSFRGDVLRSGARSPLLISFNELGTIKRALFVWRQGCRWFPIERNAQLSAYEFASLEEGGILAVSCRDYAALKNQELHVKVASGEVVIWKPIIDEDFVIRGLPPGPARVVLGTRGQISSGNGYVQLCEISASKEARVSMFSDRVTVQLPGTIYGTLSLKELSDAQFNDIEDRVVIRIIQEQPYENSGLDVGLGLVKSIHLDGMERQVNEPRSWKWIAEDLPAGAYRISSKPYGLGAEVFLEPGLASEVNLSIEALAYVDLSFQDTESGNKVSLRVARAKLIVPAFDEIESVQLWRNRKNVAMDRVEFASSPGIIYLDVFDSVYGTYNVEIEVAHGENVIVLPVSKTYLIEVEILGSGEVVAQGPCWWKEVQFFRGGVLVEILNRAYPIRPGKVFAENGVRFCVMQALTVGTGALEVVFPSIEGHKPLGTINIPPASKEETGPRRVAVSLEE